MIIVQGAFPEYSSIALTPWEERKVITMKYMRTRITKSVTLFVVILFIFSAYGVSLAQDAGTSKVIFYVK